MHSALSVALKHSLLASSLYGLTVPRLRENFCSRTRFPFSVLGLLVALCGAVPLSAGANPSSILTIRSEQSALPESIQRETYAAIDRSRATLLSRRDHEGLWQLQNNSRTIFPALALCDPVPGSYAGALTLAMATSKNEIEQNLSKAWGQTQVTEAAYTSLAARMNFGTSIDSRVLARLGRTPLSSLKSSDAALLLLALEANEIPIDRNWQTVVNNLRLSKESEVAPVAIAALGRLKSRTGDVGKPSNDVLAHARWIARRLALGGTPRFDGTPDPLTPEAAFFVSVLASQIPRQVLAEDQTLLPYDWRNHVANRLIAQQIKDPITGFDYWDPSPSPSPASDAAIWATTYAIMTLVILAE